MVKEDTTKVKKLILRQRLSVWESNGGGGGREETCAPEISCTTVINASKGLVTCWTH